MLKKIIAALMIGLVTNLAVFANETNKEKEFSEKVKSEILKLGTGSDAKITVKLKDGTKIKGYVSEIRSDSFLVVNEKNGNATEVQYSQPKQVRGNNLSKGTIIGITLGIAVGIIILIFAARN